MVVIDNSEIGLDESGHVAACGWLKWWVWLQEVVVEGIVGNVKHSSNTWD